MPRFLRLLICCAISGLPLTFSSAQVRDSLNKQSVIGAEQLMGLSFSDAKRDSMMDGLRDQLANYRGLRTVSIPNNIPPAISFNPLPIGFRLPAGKGIFIQSPVKLPAVSNNLEDLAFCSVGELAALVKARRVTSLQLTRMYLDRLKKFGPTLECVITLTEQRALEHAAQADREIAAGKYRGPLHGIPFGVKDLLATKGIRTTWGSVPYKDQMIDMDATVVKRLEDAGAVLVAKLTMGELAWGDVWFGGRTRNPWKITDGSSGSSAGSAAATSAGLVAFAIGTETWGSITSPSSICGVTGLRPTYGRVSRTGAMALSWSMDKIGPICRTVEDCAIVLHAIAGPDGVDQTLYDVPFAYQPSVSLKGMKIGYVKAEFDSGKWNTENDKATLRRLEAMGAQLVPIALPKFPLNDLSIILSAESGAAFDDLTRSGKDDLLVRQIKNAWPNSFRLARFIPAVEYIQANRIRFMVIQQMADLMKTVDLYVAPSMEGDNSLLTNLTGHPVVVLPNGWRNDGTPGSITFTGQLFGEGKLLAVAKKYQDATGFQLKHPEQFR